jgi:tetratricopeptide (TPR) repeat protein
LDLQRLDALSAAFLVPLVSFAAFSATPLEARLQKARALEETGSAVEARRGYEALLPETSSDPPTHAAVLRALAKIDAQLGDYESAIRNARRSAGEYRALSDAAGEAGALNNLGVAELYSGAYNAAERSLAAAVTLSNGVGDREGQAEQSSNLANVYYFQARYMEGLQTYEHALDLAQKADGEPWAPRRRAVVLINMATVYQRLGQDLAAMDLYRRAREQPGVLRTNEEAQLLTNLGVLYRRLGDPFKAMQAYDQARALYARDPHHDGELTVIMNRGIVLALDLAELESARRTFAEARNLAHSRASRRDEMQATLYLAQVLYRQGNYRRAEAEFHLARKEAAALGTAEEEWKALYGLGRVALRTGDAVNARALLDQAVSKIEALRGRLRLISLKFDFFADKREVYDAVIALCLKHPNPAEIFGYMERSRSRTLQDQLQVEAFALGALRASLGEHTALLEFWASPHGGAVLCASRATARIMPITLHDGDVGRLQHALATGEEWLPAAEVVAHSILPAGLIPEGTQNLVIVPDGALAWIPFEVLPYAGGLMLEQFGISYVPAAGLLARLAKKTAARRLWPWNQSFVGFGNPVFSSEALPGPGSELPLSRSADEVIAIARTLPGRSRIFLGVDDRQEFLGSPEVAGSPILHLATHATADQENPERSRILFSPARRGDTAADYLFLKRVYDLNLRGVELVTLSACETESGRLVRGEGVEGFSRAFLAAGALSVLATLWRVADGPTAEFMKLFYGNLSQGATRVESLRQAKLRFRVLNPMLVHPRYWAGFVLSGDASPVSRAMPWWWMAGPVFVVTLVATVFLRVVHIRARLKSCPTSSYRKPREPT